MQQEYNTVDVFEQFPKALEKFRFLATKLLSEEVKRAEHGDVEQLIQQEGTEVHRVMLQEYFNVREAEEPELAEITGCDGIKRNHRKRGMKRDLMTVFGEIEVKRRGYRSRETRSLFPLDGELNLPKNKYSHGLQRRIAEQVALNSFDEAVATTKRTTGGTVPKLQAEQIAVSVSQDFESFYANRQVPESEVTTDPLVLSLDGKGIVMKKESLRAATQKAAERERHKMTTRLSKGEKRNRKRMAQVGTVYSIERQVRTAESIMASDQTEQSKKPRARNKRVWASVSREAATVVNEVFEEALRRDPNKHRTWTILVDGQPQQLENIKSASERLNLSNTVLILDFIHVLEYLWKAAYCFEEEGTEAAESWVNERATRILEGKAIHVAAGIRRSATLRQLTDNERKAADLCADYLLNHQHMLKFDQYLSQGLPIATGVIEGACRHLIKDRMDITGARWGLNGAEAVLKLRSLKSSGDFEEYYNYHTAQECKRNYAALPMATSCRAA